MIKERPWSRIYNWNKDELQKWYWQDNLSLTDIAKKVGCSDGTPGLWMKHFNIPRRTDEEGIRLAHKQGKFLNKQTAELCSNWKGGRWVDPKGYVYIYKPNYHRTSRKKYIQEHILIWEQVHNRELPKGWLIHHLNGIKGDNRPENLLAMKSGQHLNQTEPYKKRIRELEAKLVLLEKALRDNQLIFGIGVVNGSRH